jgi:hypothetical protein
MRRISAAASDMADDPTTLSVKITATEKELEATKGNISVIEGGGDDLAREHGYSTRITALESLRAEKIALQNEKVELLKKENLLRQQQQQQSGAGMSMLPVRQEDVILPGQRSCCLHQQTLQFSECVLSHATLHSCGLCC